MENLGLALEIIFRFGHQLGKSRWLCKPQLIFLFLFLASSLDNLTFQRKTFSWEKIMLQLSLFFDVHCQAWCTGLSLVYTMRTKMLWFTISCKSPAEATPDAALRVLLIWFEMIEGYTAVCILFLFFIPRAML